MSGPLLLSGALHTALFLALLGLRGDEPPSRSLQIFSVELVQLADGTAVDGGQSDGADDDRPPDTAARIGANIDEPEPTDAVAAAQNAAASRRGDGAEQPEATEEPPPATVEVASAEESDAAAPLATEHDEPSTDRTATARVPPAPAAQPRPSVSDVERTGIPLEPTADDPERLAGDLERPPATEGIAPQGATPNTPQDIEPARETLSMEEAQRSMLEEKLKEWVERYPQRGLPGEDVEWEHDGQTYTATFTQLPAGDEMGLDELVVDVGTEDSGRKLSAELRMRRLAFSHYAQFVDQWDPQVQIHDDEIGGRFHSNSEIFVTQTRDATPAFHGRVTTSRGVNTSNSRNRVRRDQVFLGGLETRVRRIGLPRRFTPPTGKDGSDEDRQVHYVEEDTHIEFYADGTYGWSPLDNGEAEQRRNLPDEPFYLIAGNRVVLQVQGSVRGAVLVYSPEKIVIVGDLTYASDPSGSVDGGDFLGLVSDKDIEIADPRTTGPGDLHVHASIYAKRRFLVRRYSARGEATLYVYGSVTAGSLSATEPRYRTRIEFDPRLEQRRAPSFPVTDRFELAAWNADWTVEPDEPPAVAAGVEASRPGENGN